MKNAVAAAGNSVDSQNPPLLLRKDVIFFRKPHRRGNVRNANLFVDPLELPVDSRRRHLQLIGNRTCIEAGSYESNQLHVLLRKATLSDRIFSHCSR
jgi:hypothetical protein